MELNCLLFKGFLQGVYVSTVQTYMSCSRLLTHIITVTISQLRTSNVYMLFDYQSFILIN